MATARLAAGAAVAVLVVGAGVGAFALASDDEPPPTTTTTSTTAPPTNAELARAVAAGLATDLDVELDLSETACVSRGVVEQLGRARLLEMAEPEAVEAAMTDEQRSALVRVVVECLPEYKARALLAPSTTTTAPTGLPDEGADG